MISLISLSKIYNAFPKSPTVIHFQMPSGESERRLPSLTAMTCKKVKFGGGNDNDVSDLEEESQRYLRLQQSSQSNRIFYDASKMQRA